jgi:hypothetical protein
MGTAHRMAHWCRLREGANETAPAKTRGPVGGKTNRAGDGENLFDLDPAGLWHGRRFFT